MAEITLTSFEFRKGLLTYSTAGNDVSINDTYIPDEGMVFAMSEFSLRNLSKETFSIYNTIHFTVDYNDGYRYTGEGHNRYLSHTKGVWTFYDGGGKGQQAKLDPLMNAEYKVFIPVAQLVEDNAQTSLRIVVTLPSTGGDQEFVYRIR